MLMFFKKWAVLSTTTTTACMSICRFSLKHGKKLYWILTPLTLKQIKDKSSTLKFCVASFRASIGSRLYSSLFSEENYEDFCIIHSWCTLLYLDRSFFYEHSYWVYHTSRVAGCNGFLNRGPVSHIQSRSESVAATVSSDFTEPQRKRVPKHERRALIESYVAK